MPDTRNRLRACFTAVFPDISSAGIERATTANTADWDSVATVTLVSVVEEEFQATIDLNAVAELTSFAAFENYLASAETGRG